ncbi:MAG: HlyC/CorC family transporter [Pseudomonadota bacterium]
MDDIPLAYLLISLAVLLLLSAFFSSSETALMAVNRYKLRHRANEGDRRAARTARLLAEPDRLIGIILLGNNLVNIFAASLATVIGIRLYGDLGPFVAPLVFTPLVLIFAEVAPKTWAAVHPESLAYPASAPLSVLLRICYPFVALINLLANGLLKIFGMTSFSRSDQLSREELRTMLSDSSARATGNYRTMLLNILDLEQATVSDAMVPRNDVACIDLKEDWDTIVDQIRNSFYTRLPVVETDFEHVAGILHVRTVVNRLAAGTLDLAALRGLIRKPYYVPETTSLTQQLLEFQSRERRMGLVVDEYGDIQGLITLDDILEEIVGEFTTEPRARIRRLSRRKDGTLLVDGGENVRSLNRRLGWSLPTEGARTVNGLLLERLEAIPEAGTELNIEGLTFTITGLHDNVIKSVEVRGATPENPGLS